MTGQFDYMDEIARTTICNVCKVPYTRTFEEIKNTSNKNFVCSKCMSVNNANKTIIRIKMLDELHEIIKRLASGFKPISGGVGFKTLCQEDRELEENNAVSIINELKKTIN